MLFSYSLTILEMYVHSHIVRGSGLVYQVPVDLQYICIILTPQLSIPNVYPNGDNSIENRCAPQYWAEG